MCVKVSCLMYTISSTACFLDDMTVDQRWNWGSGSRVSGSAIWVPVGSGLESFSPYLCNRLIVKPLNLTIA